MQIDKSDANDADGPARIVRAERYREVAVKNLACHSVRATSGIRMQLVGMRTEIVNQARGLLKIFGPVPPKGSDARSDIEVRGHIAEHAHLEAMVVLAHKLAVLQHRLWREGTTSCRTSEATI